MVLRKKTLKELRNELAKIDACILSNIYLRKLYSEAIAEKKHAKNNPLRAPQVEENVYKRNAKLAKNLGLDERFVSQLTKLLITQSLHWQKSHLSDPHHDGSKESCPRMTKRRNYS